MFHPHIVRYYQAWIEESHSSGQRNETSSSESSSDEDSYLSYESLWEEHKKKNVLFLGRRVLYIQMEYCVGPTLRHVIDSGALGMLHSFVLHCIVLDSIVMLSSFYCNTL